MATSKRSKKQINADFIGGFVLGLIAVSLFFGLSGSDNEKNERRSDRPNFNEFWEVWEIIDEKYKISPDKESISDEDRVRGAIEGLTNSLEDPYSVYLPSEESEKFVDDVIFGSFEGIGIYIENVSGKLTIVSPLSGTPAERAGLKGKDLIAEIDGETAIDITTQEAANRIRGEKGSTVILKIIREGEPEPFDVPVVRDKVNIPSVENEIVDNVTIIGIRNFSLLSVEAFRDELKKYVINRREGDGLIIDLRNNPGGLLSSAVDMASFFLPFNKVVLSQSVDRDSEWKFHKSKGYDVFNKLKIDPTIAILINKGTASSSEILAGALQDHNVATIIGEKSFGKGSVQELIKIGDASLKITIAHWRTPNESFISGIGIIPDIEIENDNETEEDEQVQRAIKFLRTGK